MPLNVWKTFLRTGLHDSGDPWNFPLCMPRRVRKKYQNLTEDCCEIVILTLVLFIMLHNSLLWFHTVTAELPYSQWGISSCKLQWGTYPCHVSLRSSAVWCLSRTREPGSSVPPASCSKYTRLQGKSWDRPVVWQSFGGANGWAQTSRSDTWWCIGEYSTPTFHVGSAPALSAGRQTLSWTSCSHHATAVKGTQNK